MRLIDLINVISDNEEITINHELKGWLYSGSVKDLKIDTGMGYSRIVLNGYEVEGIETNNQGYLIISTY